MMSAAHHSTILGRAERDPRISGNKTWMALEVGLARLPHVKKCRKSGKPDLRATSPAMTAERAVI
jgi:hypothetical protein